MSRKLTVLLVSLAALGGPAAAFASGPSAGDQQYTDPLAPKHHAQTTTSTTPASPTTAPAQSLTPTASSSSGSTGTTKTTAPDPGGKSLPFTGYNALLGLYIGGCLLSVGVFLNRSIRSRSAHKRPL